MRARAESTTLTRVVTSFEVPPYAVQDAVRIDPARTALVVIDMQNDFVQRGGSLLVPLPAQGRGHFQAAAQLAPLPFGAALDLEEEPQALRQAPDDATAR